jgi:AbrB family looped-hinge helix DNA binding protein
MLATITSKGQITLPGDLRKKLNLRTGDRVDFFLRKDGHLEGIPIKQPVSNLKNLLPKPKNTASLEDMEKAIAVRGARKK